MSTQTLLDLFDPPEGMVGHSAALVAMTAAADFLEAAMQRFTGLRPRQRAELGTVVAYLMLDGHTSAGRQSVLPPGRVPGLHEFQPCAVDPASLLHAKLALLGFAPNRTAEPSHLRLAVLTANYTYTSARQQLELVWTVDVPLNPVASAEDRIEVAAAGAFVEQLLERRFHRDEQSLPIKQRRLTSRLGTLLAAAARVAPANRVPRFIHSLDQPLYDQIRQRLRKAVDSPRNFLLCGSGFYEQPSDKGGKPKVFTNLEDICAFTSNARHVALVEPDQAGAVGPWAKLGMDDGKKDGWEIARPTDALNRRQPRRLHAKFVYVGYLRDGYVSNGWMYLGSGNLSIRGLRKSGMIPGGNIECGIVLSVGERLDQEEMVRQLFWNEGAARIDADEWSDGVVGDAPETPTLISPPPILSAAIESQPARALQLRWREDAPNEPAVSVSWTGHDWEAVGRSQNIVPLREADEPTALHVRDDVSPREWTVPVVDLAGRVCWQPRRFETYADALEALLDFPIRPAEASDDDDDDDDDDDHDDTGHVVRSTTTESDDSKSYPLYAASELIEKIASLQVALPETMLDDWIEHLDRMFRASFPQPLMAKWREHHIDVFFHLRKGELRPREMSESQCTRYFDVLDRAARAWGLP